jgi:hypothetical protein
MDHNDDLITQRGDTEASATIADEARELRRRLSFIRVMAAAAAARELCRRGIPAPSGTWQFVQGWSALMKEMRNAKATYGPLPEDAVRMIASGSSIDEPRPLIMSAGLLLSLMQHGFIPPDPRPSEDYQRGWEAACQALRDSHEARLLAEALAEAREELES